ncbi:hypothetical protein [Zobellia alginiliquefaciens]|nr:hypothetical protein [Zobellia alginiliquefaciens]
MNRKRSFYPEESNSSTIDKKNEVELSRWTEDIEYINKELEYILDTEF